MNKSIKYNYDKLIEDTNIEVIFLNYCCDDLRGVIKCKNEYFFNIIEPTSKDKSIIRADLESWLYNLMKPKDFKDKMLLRMLIFDIKTTRIKNINNINNLSSTQTLIITGDNKTRPLYTIFSSTDNKYSNVKNLIAPKNNKYILNFRGYHLNYEKNCSKTIDSIKDFNEHFKDDFVLDKIIEYKDILILKDFVIELLNNKSCEGKYKIVLKNQYHAEIVIMLCKMLEIDEKNVINDKTPSIDIIDENIVESNVKDWLDKYLIWDKEEVGEYSTLFELITNKESNAISFDYILFCYLMEYEIKNT